MNWIKLDNNFLENRKIDSLSPLAKLLYLDGLLYSSRQMTDGFIPKSRVGAIEQQPLVAEILSVSEWSNGLWYEVEGGYQIHDIEKYQKPKAYIEEVQRKNQEKLANWRKRKRLEEGETVTGEVTASVTDGVTKLQGELVTQPEFEVKEEKEFQEFWNLYPRKDGLKDCRDAFRDAIKRNSFPVILEGVIRYIEFLKKSDQAIAIPAHWLRAERWNDQTPLANSSILAKRTDHYSTPLAGCYGEFICGNCHQSWPCATERSKNDNPF